MSHPATWDEIAIVAASAAGWGLTAAALHLRLRDTAYAPDVESRYVASRRVMTHVYGLAYHTLMLTHGVIRLTFPRADVSTLVLVALYALPLASLAVVGLTANDLLIRRGVKRLRHPEEPRR